MSKRQSLTSSLILIAVLLPAPAMSTVVFDFDDVPVPSRRTPGGPLVEVYMEGLYGSNVSVSPNTSAAHGSSIHNALDVDNSYLKIGKGKGPSAIVIHFDDNPIDSFSIDFKLFKKAKNFSIYADGELISMDALSKAQRKTGMAGQKTFFFDSPVHTLEFVGKKKSFAIDNLVVDLPEDGETGIILQQLSGTLPSDTNNNNNNEGNTSGPTFIATNLTGPETQNQVAVPEPSSFLLLAIGLAALRSRLVSRRSRSRSRV